MTAGPRIPLCRVRADSTTALYTCATKEKERQAPYVTCESRLYYCSLHNEKRKKMMAGPRIPLCRQIIWKQFCSKLYKTFTETSVMFQNLHVHTNLEIPEKVNPETASTWYQNIALCRGRAILNFARSLQKLAATVLTAAVKMPKFQFRFSAVLHGSVC
uniref:Uncharacterized protein n=1 Tax=Timema tahoe TaxID=61484 RepID=A0A7R9IQW1_9NEOP|nr:unnamed protein product [Timema tahoe]